MSKMLYTKHRKNNYILVDLYSAYRTSQEATFKYHHPYPGLFTLFAILMLSFIIGGAYNTYKISLLNTHGILTTGTITSYQVSGCGNRSREVDFKVQFFTTHHLPVTTESATDISCNPIEDTETDIKVGQQVDVLYNPDDPRDAIVTTFLDSYTGRIEGIVSIIFGSLGFAFYAISKIRFVINFFQIRQHRKFQEKTKQSRTARKIAARTSTSSQAVRYTRKGRPLS